ncbi:MAG: aldo/keto reductase [Thermoanaerobaculia bacterium]
MSAPVERVELGPGYSIARAIVGCWQLARDHGGAYDRSRAVRELVALAERGFTTFDVADIYFGAEELLGELVRRRPRGELQIHTKYVPDRSALVKLGRRDIEKAIDRSLARLGIERLDLVQLHWWDWGEPGWLEAAGTLRELIRAGKVRALGITNFDRPRLEALLEAGVPVVSHQLQYSVVDRRPEEGMADLCRSAGIAMMAYGTLAGGFLSERWLGAAEPESGGLANRSLVKYRLILDEYGDWDAVQGLLRALAEIAAKHGAGIAAVATRWALERPGVAAAILGAGVRHRPGEALSLFSFCLDREDRERLDAIRPPAAGPRGDVYGVEREPGGRHAAILRTELNREVGS